VLELSPSGRSAAGALQLYELRLLADPVSNPALNWLLLLALASFTVFVVTVMAR